MAILSHGQADTAIKTRIQDLLESTLNAFPWRIEVVDWDGHAYAVGQGRDHWSGLGSLRIHIKTTDAGRDLLAMNVYRFLERFIAGEVDFEGNLYLFPEIRNYAKITLSYSQILANRAANLLLQNPNRAKVSVKSHYDIPEQALFYLDRRYRSYSCAIWQEPGRLDTEEALIVGQGQSDDFDSLEKAQWRKFKHAADYLAPGPDETVLDVGCGYPGFLEVLSENHRCKQVVGWTHSSNQVREGKAILAERGLENCELHEGDYRNDKNVYDHIHSTGMISHVGPPGPDSGLVNYVTEVRARIRTGGRYVHHALMTAYTGRPLFEQIGPAINRKYVWPGFYWYTLADHIQALERNGFQIVQMFNLSPHYAKTTMAWYERLMAGKEQFVEHAGESTLRAWQLFLAGVTGSFHNRLTHVYRIFCEATDVHQPAIGISDPMNHPAARIRVP